jgi:hypothetical protein
MPSYMVSRPRPIADCPMRNQGDETLPRGGKCSLMQWALGCPRSERVADTAPHLGEVRGLQRLEPWESPLFSGFPCSSSRCSWVASPQAVTLVRELGAFQRKATAAAEEELGAWHEGAHDDLVLAVAAAACLEERTLRRLVIGM